MNHDETPLVIVLRKLTNPFGQCFVQKEPEQPVLKPSVVTVFMRRPRQMRCTPAHTRRTISHAGAGNARGGEKARAGASTSTSPRGGEGRQRRAGQFRTPLTGLCVPAHGRPSEKP